MCLATAGTNTHGRSLDAASRMDSIVGGLYCSFKFAHMKEVNGRENDECVGAPSLHAYMSAGVCVRACVRVHMASCLCVLACLSHDVLWQSLTNRTGASRRWGSGGKRRA